MWVLKMNTEFNGRGIAKFDAESSKKLKQILSLSETNVNNQIQNVQPRIKQKIKREIKQMVI